MQGSQAFFKLSRVTLIAVYVLILVGGVVRSTGAGMGCPDWPKCFGTWVPPTTVEELPTNYKEIYSEYRHTKNERLAGYLEIMGFSNMANRILTDESIREEADFNPVKTWIEYVNRLVGAVIGLLIFAVFVLSLKYWNTYRNITLLSLFTFILVGFQGWIGSIVVSTNLMPWTITLHMFLALVIVALLIYLVHVSQPKQGLILHHDKIITWLIVCTFLTVIQVILGTQVRESLDRVAALITEREKWIGSLGFAFIIHRSFSWVILATYSILIVKLYKTREAKGFTLALIVLILCAILSGTGMAYFSVPAFLQPLHLIGASLMFGVLFILILRFGRVSLVKQVAQL